MMRSSIPVILVVLIFAYSQLRSIDLNALYKYQLVEDPQFAKNASASGSNTRNSSQPIVSREAATAQNHSRSTSKDTKISLVRPSDTTVLPLQSRPRNTSSVPSELNESLANKTITTLSSEPKTPRKDERKTPRRSDDTESKTISRSERLNILNITGIPRSNRSLDLTRDIYGEQFDNNFNIIAHFGSRSNPNNDSRHVFLHIGKAGGSSLINSKVLASGGKFRRKVVAVLHGNHLMHMSADLNFVEDMLVVLRSPIDRMVSWFYFTMRDHENKKLLRKRGEIDYRKKIFTCFPEVQHLALALTNTSTPCHRFALHILHGIGPPDGIAHMFHNTMYYTRQGLLRRRDLPVYVMRTKHLWSDFANAYGDNNGQEPANVKVDHGTVKNEHNSSISPDLYFPLCCSLVEELDAYRYVLFRANNDVAPNETLAEALSLCSVTSLEQLVDECPNHLLHPNYQDPGTNVSLSLPYSL